MGFEPYEHDYRTDEDHEDKELLIADIHNFIDMRIADDESGEPPDEDTVIEGMGLSDDKWDLVRKAYELYWNR